MSVLCVAAFGLGYRAPKTGRFIQNCAQDFLERFLMLLSRMLLQNSRPAGS